MKSALGVFKNKKNKIEDSILSDDELIQLGRETLDYSWKLLNSDGWKLDKEENNGDQVHFQNVPKYGKLFRITGEVECPPLLLKEAQFDNIEHLPEWNHTIISTRRIRRIDEHTDITYNVTMEGGGGLVSSRDFVNLRRWELIDGCYVLSGSSITHPDAPVTNYIRGVNGPGAWVMRPIPDNPNKCIFQWLNNTDMKGWLPQYIVDVAFSTVMFEYLGQLRALASTLQNKGLF